MESINDKLLINRYSVKEEIANSITHGIGILFSIVSVTILLVYAFWQKSVTSIVGFSVYGLCSTASYVSSTLYHSFRIEKVKKVLRVLDHSAIYLFIAGTYTPVTLLCIKGSVGFIILTAIWTIAIVGISIKILTKKEMEKYKGLSLVLYILMGWMIVFAIKPMLQNVPFNFLMWLLAGGLFYTVGVIFYANKKIPYNHAIWHLFVLGGSVMHFIGIFIYLR